MTATPHTYFKLACDAPSCDAVYASGWGVTRAQARKILRKRGWTTGVKTDRYGSMQHHALSRSLDYCPDHKPEEAPDEHRQDDQASGVEARMEAPAPVGPPDQGEHGAGGDPDPASLSQPSPVVGAGLPAAGVGVGRPAGHGGDSATAAGPVIGPFAPPRGRHAAGKDVPRPGDSSPGENTTGPTPHGERVGAAGSTPAAGPGHHDGPPDVPRPAVAAGRAAQSPGLATMPGDASEPGHTTLGQSYGRGAAGPAGQHAPSASRGAGADEHGRPGGATPDVSRPGDLPRQTGPREDAGPGHMRVGWLRGRVLRACRWLRRLPHEIAWRLWGERHDRAEEADMFDLLPGRARRNRADQLSAWLLGDRDDHGSDWAAGDEPDALTPDQADDLAEERARSRRDPSACSDPPAESCADAGCPEHGGDGPDNDPDELDDLPVTQRELFGPPPQGWADDESPFGDAPAPFLPSASMLPATRRDWQPRPATTGPGFRASSIWVCGQPAARVTRRWTHAGGLAWPQPGTAA